VYVHHDGVRRLQAAVSCNQIVMDSCHRLTVQSNTPYTFPLQNKNMNGISHYYLPCFTR
jgi:hypothetical protein